MERNSFVLYVDNNPSSRRLLGHLLEECGFEVVASGDPTEALELCRIESFDLALVTYNLSPMTGSELAKRIKSRCPGLPVIMISGCTLLPPSELVFVDAHFGRGTSFDELSATMRMLSHSMPKARDILGSAAWAGST